MHGNDQILELIRKIRDGEIDSWTGDVSFDSGYQSALEMISYELEMILKRLDLVSR